MSSVAVVVLDTLRYDAFERAFEWLEGERFSQAYSTSHWTIPAHASLLTGRYASEVGVHGRSPTLDCPNRTLPEAFQEAGFHTVCLTANTQLSQYEGWDRGFDIFDGPANLGRTDDQIFDWGRHVEETEPGIGRYLAGAQRCLAGGWDTLDSLRYGYNLHRTPTWDGGAQAVRRRLRSHEVVDEEFLFVNLMEAHTPYHPPPDSDDPVTVVIADALAGAVEDSETVRMAYQASVEYLADIYRDIIAELEASYDYVVTLADHGEHLGEHGLWNHSIGLHPELTHVPLVVNGPDVESGTRDGPVNLLDVHRTVAGLAGIEVKSGGRDLFGTLGPKPLLFESHGLLPFHRSQFERTGAPISEFDRWQTPLSGFVTKDGAYCYEAEPGRFRTLGETTVTDPRRRLETLRGRLDTREVGDEEMSVSAEVRDRLEELGYA